jgi:hypothetical protein
VDTITRSVIMVITLDTINQSESIMVTVALTIQSAISTAIMGPGTRSATTTVSINLQ